jgi:hypothetical protein
MSTLGERETDDLGSANQFLNRNFITLRYLIRAATRGGAYNFI